MNVSDKKGYSLIELILVIAVLSIILLIGALAYPRIVQSMQIRTDRVSANQISKSLRLWYECNTSDTGRNIEFIDFINNELYEKTVSLKSLEAKGVSTFIDSNYKPESLVDSNWKKVEDQAFFVGVIGNGKELKFVITVETEEDRLEEINSASEVNYDGNSVGVIYIER